MACRLRLLALWLWLTLFWEKGWGPPCDSHRSIRGGGEGLVEKKCRVLGSEGVVVHDGAKARCVAWSGFCSLSLFPEETTWVALGSVAQMCFLLSAQNSEREHLGLQVSSDRWVLQAPAIGKEAVPAFCSPTNCDRVSSSSRNAQFWGWLSAGGMNYVQATSVPFSPWLAFVKSQARIWDATCDLTWTPDGTAWTCSY